MVSRYSTCLPPCGCLRPNFTHLVSPQYSQCRRSTQLRDGKKSVEHFSLANRPSCRGQSDACGKKNAATDQYGLTRIRGRRQFFPGMIEFRLSLHFFRVVPCSSVAAFFSVVSESLRCICSVA